MKGLERMREIGLQQGHALYRVCLYEDGRGEAEFAARNPWECLLVKWGTPSDLDDLLAPGRPPAAFFERASLRKKCIRCLLHERPVTVGDL